MAGRNGTVLVFGAGPAGLTASIAAARLGAQVTLVEKTEVIGRKLSMTGNGRANLTNRILTPHDYNQAAETGMLKWLPGFDAAQLSIFLDSVGLFTRTEGDGIYPVSGQAQSVTEALTDACRAAGVQIVTGAQLKKIEPSEHGFCCTAGGQEYRADAVILATGGLSGPRTCHASGDAYYLCEQLGIKLVPRYPALVPLLTKDETLPDKTGVRTFASVRFESDGNTIAEEAGEIQFASGTLSGIPVLQASGRIAQVMAQGKEVTARIDLLPDHTKEQWRDARKLMLRQAEHRPVLSALRGLVNAEIAESIGRRLGIAEGDELSVLTDAQRDGIFDQVRDFPVRIEGIGDYTRAQATAGGVDLKEIDAHCQSVRVPGLYLTGELVDVDGRCGGYNLHWAFMSGIMAGIHAATGEDWDSQRERVVSW